MAFRGVVLAYVYIRTYVLASVVQLAKRGQLVPPSQVCHVFTPNFKGTVTYLSHILWSTHIFLLPTIYFIRMRNCVKVKVTVMTTDLLYIWCKCCEMGESLDSVLEKCLEVCRARSPYDAVAVSLHACLLAEGFVCIAIGDEVNSAFQLECLVTFFNTDAW